MEPDKKWRKVKSLDQIKTGDTVWDRLYDSGRVLSDIKVTGKIGDQLGIDGGWITRKGFPDEKQDQVTGRIITTQIFQYCVDQGEVYVLNE